VAGNRDIDAALSALWKQKWWMAIAAIVAAGAAAAIASLGADRYQTTALLEVGRVLGEPIDDPWAVAKMLESEAFRGTVAEHAGTRPPRIAADAVTAGQGRGEHPVLVRVTGSGESPQEAVAAGDAVVAEILARHKVRYEQALAVHRAHQDALAAAASKDPQAQREMLELASKLGSPVLTRPTSQLDPFPLPRQAVPRRIGTVAGVAALAVAAIAALVVIATAQCGAASPTEDQ
jgi:hypothetical protein